MGYTLATFVLRHLVEQEPDVWENLIDDMTPLFLNVSRRIKQVEGADFLNRNNKVNIADYEGIVTAIDKNCKNYKKTLESILKEIPDNDKDPFKLTMPVMFAKAEAAVNELVKLREKTQEDYKKMLKQLNMESSLKADDFCMMWDKFLVPEGLILAFDPQQRSKFIIPKFCADKSFYPDDLSVLWGFKAPKVEKKKEEDEGKKGKKAKKHKFKGKDDEDEGDKKKDKEKARESKRPAKKDAGEEEGDEEDAEGAEAAKAARKSKRPPTEEELEEKEEKKRKKKKT